MLFNYFPATKFQKIQSAYKEILKRTCERNPKTNDGGYGSGSDAAKAKAKAAKVAAVGIGAEPEKNSNGGTI